jgi:hypothetical protein
VLAPSSSRMGKQCSRSAPAEAKLLGKQRALAACKDTSGMVHASVRDESQAAQDASRVTTTGVRSPPHSQQAALRQRKPRAPQSGQAPRRAQRE